MSTSLLAVTCSLIILTTACGTQPPTAVDGDETFGPAPGAPVASANANCRYNPSGEDLTMPVGGSITFVPVVVADCAGAWAFLTQTDGRAGFGATGACGSFAVQAAGIGNLIKIHRCFTGPVEMKIYTNSSKTVFLQRVGIDLL